MMGIFSIRHGVAACCAMAVAICGCTSMPTHGDSPSAHAILASDAWRKSFRVAYDVPIVHSAPVVAAAWHPDSDHLAVLQNSSGGFVFDTAAGKPGTKLPALASPRAIAYSPDGALILLSGRLLERPQNLHLALTAVDAQSGQLAHEVENALPGAPPIGDSAAMDSTGTIVYDAEHSEILIAPFGTPIVGYRGLEVVDPATWTARLRPFKDFTSGLFAIQPHGKDIAFSVGGGTALVYDRTTGDSMRKIVTLPSWSNALAYSPDGNTLLTAMTPDRDPHNPGFHIDSIKEAEGHKVTGWSARDGYALGRLIDVRLSAPKSIAFHPDGKIFAVGSGDEVVLFDRSSFALVSRTKVSALGITTVSFSPDGKSLAVGGSDHLVVLGPAG